MKRAVIITECRRFCFNYGETLQAVALNRLISDMGYRCITASYENTRANLKYRLRRAPKKYLIRGLRFERFRQKYMRYPMMRSSRKEKFEAALRQADVAICGSDCIWYEKVCNEIFFLNFPEIKIPKIAYAPSLRDSRATDQKYAVKVRRWAKNIDYLSTREEEGSQVIREITGRQVKTVLDPTLLLSAAQWDEMASGRIEKAPYIFCYVIGRTRHLKYMVRDIRRHFGVEKVIWISMEQNDGYSYGEGKDNMGPAEFLSLIKYAEAVITDSFHGTAFSVIYHKQVFAVKRELPNDNYDYDARIRNIMRQLGIQNYYSSRDAIEFDKAVINYASVQERMDDLIRESMEYLEILNQ